jgi:hypothetical protein
MRRRTRGPFVSRSPILPGDEPIAFFRVKHFSPGHKFLDPGHPEKNPRERFVPGGNIY